MLEAGPISLVDMYTPVDRYSLFASLLFPHSFQQVFRSSRLPAPETYHLDLADFLAVYNSRIKWLKDNHFHFIHEYCAIPGGDMNSSQFLLAISFEVPEEAANYRKHFKP